MKKDQAASLREKFNVISERKTDQGQYGVRSLSFTSGKGGVGKTNIVVNLAMQLSRMGKKVFLLDADLGLANIDIMLNLTPAYTIEDVLSGKKNINDIIVEGPMGVHIVPASSGVVEMTELNSNQQMSMLKELSGLKTKYDYILIDTGAGIASSVLRFNAAADEICVVTNSEPTAMTDAYALMKIMATKYQIKRFNLIVNQSTLKEAQEVYQRLSTVFNQFLPIHLIFMGFIPRDPNFTKAVKNQKPLSLLMPNSATTKAFGLIAKHIDANPGLPFFDEGLKGGFWQKLAKWKKN
ncbi:MAG: MinD/ParA family protein [Deltaproteobacteria bacterium]|nr:MinD/ParA family protein [Deltaproteobacteria bacterium]